MLGVERLYRDALNIASLVYSLYSSDITLLQHKKSARRDPYDELNLSLLLNEWGEPGYFVG